MWTMRKSIEHGSGCARTTQSPCGHTQIAALGVSTGQQMKPGQCKVHLLSHFYAIPVSLTNEISLLPACC